ncbi:TonB-dependent receptor [Pontibacter liquoris]|uniref:TonB-dependent receptor n=1 Tax=Pontibacter liquoris TaxID=2905677 RepID=UPI001FA70A6C|nr:TonB-dependent receptor [Pontibacter liquoris]
MFKLSLKPLALFPILVLGWGAQPLLAQALPDGASGVAADQNCGLTLSGKVMDHDTRAPLVGATVYIPQLNLATGADEYGNYHFHNLCQGTYTLQVTYVGYEKEENTYKVTSSATRDLQLHSDQHLLRAVEVTGARLKEQAQSAETLSGRQLAETRGLSLAASLQGLAGVSSLQTGPTIAKPVIHGMHSNRVLLLNNGVRQEGQQWGSEHAPEIDPFVATEMKVIKGAAGVRYGADALGGVVIVEPRALPDSAAALAGELNLLGTTNNRQGAVSGTVEGSTPGLPLLRWRLQGTLKKAGNASAPDYYLQNTGFNERNFSAALGYQQKNYGAELFYSQFNTRLGILSASHIGNITDINNAIERGRPFGADTVQFTYAINRPYQDIRHDLLKAKAYLNTGTAGKLSFTYGWQNDLRDEYDVHNAESGHPAMHLAISTHTTEALWEHKPIANLTGSVGVNTIYQDNTWKYSDFIPFFTSFNPGVFVLEKWRKDRLQLEGGLRYDYKHVQVKELVENQDVVTHTYDYNNVSGSVGAMYDIGYHLTLGLSAASAWRAPGVNELFSDGVHHASGTYEIGDPNLVTEKAYNFEASAEYFASPRLSGQLSVYNNYIDNYIYQAPTQTITLSVNGAFPTFKYKQVGATFRGFDLSLQYKLLEQLTLDSKTAIVRARNTSTGEWLVGIPADRYDNSLRYTFGHNSKRTSNSYLAIGGQYVAEQTRYPTKADQDYALPPDAYFLLHAEAGTTLHLGKQPLEIGITGNNLLNTSYRDYLNRFRYYADDLGRMLLFRVRVPLAFSKS